MKNLGVLASAPQQIGQEIERLKASPGGRKLTEINARVGRAYARANAMLWFLVCAAIFAVGFFAVSLTEGRVATVVALVIAIPFAGAMWLGVSRLRSPRAASEILIEQLEDRVKPATWLLRMVRAFSGRASGRAEQP